MPQTDLTALSFEASILDALKLGARLGARQPWIALRAVRLISRQARASKVRQRHRARGVHVPPFCIHSVTSRCNLHCTGCYAHVLHKHENREEMDDARTALLFSEAQDLGISVILLAGGEPLLRERLLHLTEAAPEILFLLFSNGSRMDASAITHLKKQPHVLPVLSLEGPRSFIDARRGPGTHEAVLALMDRLKKARIFFGTATTLTRENLEDATGKDHVTSLVQHGCRLFFYINYVPAEPGTESMQLPPEQVQTLTQRLDEYRQAMGSLFISFPQDEVALGGCLAAGRGFVHINAYGDIEPCPFSPYSDRSLRQGSLLEALKSPFLERIRTADVVLDESNGQCALWQEKRWVQQLWTDLVHPST